MTSPLSKRVWMDGSVAAFNSDDIFCEILIRLPPELVIKLVTVSKRWLQFISTPTFCQNYSDRWGMNFRLLGFFPSSTLYLGRPRDGLRRPKSEPALSLLSTCDEGHDLGISGILRTLGYFIDCSNGLLLCGRHPKTYYVWNPITRDRHQLPPPRVYFEELCMAFVVEDVPSEDMTYKVVRAKCETTPEMSSTVPIETFNPKTRTWNYSTLTCPTKFALRPWTTGTVIKGVIHWFTDQGNIAIYDTNDGGRRISLTKLPGSTDYEERILGESSDMLLQYGWSNTTKMEIWVLETEYGGCKTPSSSVTPPNCRWMLKYKLNFKTLWRKNPTLKKKSHKETQILSFLPRNSESVFIRTESDIFQCHLVSKTLDMLPYHGNKPMWDFCKVVPYFRPCWPHSSVHGDENRAPPP